jgi:hypothetical protein
VRLNSAISAYIKEPEAGRTLMFRTPQAQFALSPGIHFPTSAVEMKADWIQLEAAQCNEAIRLKTIWVEQIGSQCYALAGMHFTSQLMPNWIWATFEPQEMATNPQRCVVLGCNDPFGSDPAKTPQNRQGTTTQISRKLKELMTAAKLNPIWQNYRLDGVQTEFVDKSGSPVLLGNSIIEGENADVPLNQSSCITCHAASSISTTGSETFGQNLLKTNPIGKRPTLPANVYSRGFVWSLSEACPSSNFRTCRNGYQ